MKEAMLDDWSSLWAKIKGRTQEKVPSLFSCCLGPCRERGSELGAEPQNQRGPCTPVASLPLALGELHSEVVGGEGLGNTSLIFYLLFFGFNLGS